MEKRERVKPSSDPVMDKIFGNSTQDKTPVSKTAKPSSDPVMDAVFQKKNDGGNVSSTSSVPSDTSVSESTSQTPEPKQSLENSTPIKPTAFNSPILSSDQLQALFDAPKQFNENPNPKKVSAGEFLAKDIETHAPNIFENVAKVTGQAMPFADKMSEFDKQHIAKETKLNVMNNPADMSNYVATRVKALRGSISDLEKDKLAYTDFANSGGTVIKDQAAYDKANEKIAQKQNYINDLKNNVAELASAKVLEKVDFKNFLPQDIGRQIVKISDPELDLQFQQAEKFGSLPGGRRAELEKIGIDAARNYLNKNPDIPNAKEAKAFLNDTESTFDIRNSEATAARVRSKLGQYFYNEGGVQDKSGVFGYSEKNLRDALNDPKLVLTPSERQIAETVVLPTEKRIWGTDIPGSGFARSFRGAIEKSAEGTVKSVLDMTGARNESSVAIDNLSQAENTRYAEVNNRSWVSRRLDGIGDLTGQVAMMALASKGLGAALPKAGLLKTLTSFGAEDGLLGRIAVKGADKFLSGENMSLFVNSYLNSYDNYRQQATELMPGDTESQDHYSKSMAFIEGLSEKIFNDTKVLKAFTGEVAPTVKDITKRFLSNELTAEAAKGELSSGIKKYAKTFAKDYVKSTVEESFEEGIVDVADGAAQSIYGGTPFDLAKTGQKALNTFLTTAINSPLVAGLAAHGAIRQQKQEYGFYKSALTSMASNPGEYLKSVDDLEVNKEITSSEANEKRKIIKSASKLLNELPETRTLPVPESKTGETQEVKFTPAETTSFLVHGLNQQILQDKIDKTTNPIVQQDLKKQLNRSQNIQKGIYDGSISVNDNLQEVAETPEQSEKLNIINPEAVPVQETVSPIAGQVAPDIIPIDNSQINTTQNESEKTSEAEGQRQGNERVLTEDQLASMPPDVQETVSGLREKQKTDLGSVKDGHFLELPNVLQVGSVDKAGNVSLSLKEGVGIGEAGSTFSNYVKENIPGATGIKDLKLNNKGGVKFTIAFDNGFEYRTPKAVSLVETNETGVPQLSSSVNISDIGKAAINANYKGQINEALPKDITNATPYAKVNNDTKEFITKSGNQKVVREDGKLSVVNALDGKPSSEEMAKKALKEYALNYDYTEGEKAPAPKEDAEYATEKELKSDMVDKSNSPSELAAIYLGEEKESPELSEVDNAIIRNGIKTKEASYNMFGDKNRKTPAMALAYFTSDGKSLDVQAQEMSENSGIEITTEDLVNFMERFPNGVYQATQASESSVAYQASNKFFKLTGLELNPETAAIAVEQEYSKLDFINQALLNDSYESERAVTDAYIGSLEGEENNAPVTNTSESKVDVAGGELGQSNNETQPVAETETTNVKPTITEAGKALADKLRGLKTSRSNAYGNIFGVAVGVYDGLIEAIARAVEGGAVLADAIKTGIDSLSVADKRKLNEHEFTQHLVDLSEGKKPKIKYQLSDETTRVKSPEEKKAEAEKEKIDQRRFTQQVLDDKSILPEVRSQLKNNLDYIVARNAVTASEAEFIMANHTPDEVYDIVVNNEDTAGAVRVVLGEALIKKYNDLALKAIDPKEHNKYIDKTVDVANFVSVKLGTEAGRIIQAFSLYGRMTKEGQVRWARKERKEQGEKQTSKAAPEVTKLAKKIQDINVETASEIVDNPEVKKAVKQTTEKKEKRIKDKIEKIQDKRASIIKKYKEDKGKNLYAAVGLTNEGIEFVGNVAATYIQEGVANVELLIDKIKSHLQEVSGKPITSEVDADLVRLANDAFTKAQEKESNRSERLVNEGLKNTDQKIGDIVKQHFSQVEETKRTLTEKLVSDAGLEGAEAAELSKKLQDAFDRIATKKKQKLLEVEKKRFDRIQNKMVGAKKVASKEVQDEIIRYSNLGAFSDLSMMDKMRDMLGTGALSPQEAAEIERLADIVQRAGDGSPKREATEDLLRYRANLKGSSWGEVLQGVYYANVLSGYRTHLKNITDTFFSGMAAFANEFRKDPRSLPYLMVGAARGLKIGLNEARYTAATGRSPIHVAKVETPSILERKDFIFGKFNPTNWLKYVGRLLAAEDVIQFRALNEMKAYQYAYKEAKALGYKNASSKEIWKIVDEKLMNTKDRFDAAKQQAEEEGLTGYKMRRRTSEIMELNRPVQMREESYGFGALGTYNHATQGTLGAITDSFAKTLDINIKGFRPFRLVVPFTRVITNVVNNKLDYTPIGLIRGVRKVRGFEGFTDNPGIKDKYHVMTDDERDTVIGKASLGIALTAALYAMTKYKDKDDKPLIEITGAGPLSFSKQAELKLQGWKPYSIKIGDHYISYELTPLVFNLAMVGAMDDHEKYNTKEKEDHLWEKISVMATQGVKMVADMTWIGSTSTLLGAIANPDAGKAEKEVSNILGNTTKGFLIPNFYTQLAQQYQSINNLPQKDVKGIWDNLIQDIPIARNTLNDKINALGDPIVRNSPLMISAETKDPVWRYLLEHRGWVAPINRNTLMFKDKAGLERPATEDEYYKFAKERGAIIKKGILGIIENGAVVEKDDGGYETKSADKLTPKELQKELRSISSSASKDVHYDMQSVFDE